MRLDREDAIAWRHGAHDLVCDRIEPWAHGVVVRATRFPAYYDFNTLRLEGPDPGVSAEELVAEADRLQQGLAHRKVEVEDAAAGERLRPEMEARGWRTTRLLWMVHEGPPPDAPGDIEVEDADRGATRELRLEWTDNFTREQIEEFMPTADAVAARVGERTGIVRGESGAPVAFATYLAGPDGGEVLNVFVSERARRRGIGRALTSWTARRAFAAGAPHVWITADDEYHAKDLYADLGFRPVWISHEFVRDPEAA